MVDTRSTGRSTRPAPPGHVHRAHRARRGWGAVGALVLALPLVLVTAVPAAAATWGIGKQEISTGPYAPGQDIQWVVTVSCSDPNADPCEPTTMTDALPAGLVLVGASVQSGPAGGVLDADTATSTVTYTNPSVPNGGQVQVLVTAQVDPDLPYSQSGIPLTNTATVVSDNAPETSASDDITPVVELVLGSETTKTIEPAGALAAAGTPATVTLGATSTSNAPVDTLVVQDPVDPAADPNPFDLLEYTGTGDVTLPPDADTVTEEYWDGAAWVALDDSVDPTAVRGLRYTFSGDIQPGATATIPVEVQQSEAVADLAAGTTVTNDASSSVSLGDEQSAPDVASDTYVITPTDASVEASKSIDPATVSAGAPTTVTVGGTNTGTAVGTLTVTEPAPGTPSPFEGEAALTFTGFGPDGDGTGVTWPTAATAAAVTFTCADGSVPSESTTTVGTLPGPPPGCDVTGFSVQFSGDIVSGGQASIPFTAVTDADQDARDVTRTNVVLAEVPGAQDTAAADLVTLADRLATVTTKVISPSTIPSVPGQSVVVQLPTQLAPFGPDGSTADADQVVVQDPADPAAPGPFWDSFTATSVRTTDVPAGSTLTVRYWDGDSWEPAPACGPFPGPDTVGCDLPAGAQGVQLVYDSTAGGFPPGTTFQPNFTAAFTGPAGADEPVENCAASSASSSTVAPTPPAVGCATVDPFPVDGDGDLALVDKTFLGDDPVSVLARSDGQVTARLTWSTGGFSGVDPMVVSDVADPETTDLADSFYDAFDLVRVGAVDSTVDPLVAFDAIVGVELYDGTGWVQAAGSTCTRATPCQGGMPAVVLTDDERESTTSVRLVYTEGDGRATDGDPLAPQPGDGVARSTLADGRHVDLTFQVRDDRRSGTDLPVLGSTSGTLYNTPDPGLVADTVRGTGTFAGEEYTGTASDDVLIIDQPLNVAVTKDWTGGPVSVPPAATPADDYPSTTVSIVGTNASAAKVDQLRLVEPGIPTSGAVQAGAGTRPFDAFDLRGIDVTAPAGTEQTLVVLFTTDGGAVTVSEAIAESAPPGALADVVGVEVVFDGLVEPGAAGTLDLTLRLRADDRYTGAPVTVADHSPVPDGAVATIDDPGGTDADVRLAYDDADMTLQDAGTALEVGKTFSPGAIVEPGTGPSTMTITGQPLGPSRSVEMVLTDDDPQFWNQYDLLDLASPVLAAPIQQVRVDAFVGGTFSGTAGSPDPVTVSGGGWVLGDASGTFALPDGVVAGDVQGLRFTFSRTDGGIWENPANPLQAVPVVVERREDLRSGGPVLPDLESSAPAPGETDPGVASNTVTGSTTGADLVVDPETGDLVPVTATDDAQAQVVYRHAQNGVQVVKDFNGVVTGGTTAPDALNEMRIAVTNTGDRAVVDPVVVDSPMPSDAEGPQLRLAEVAEPYAYTLTGPPPGTASGPPMPTDPTAVTVDATGDLEALTFTFPEGTVLEVGQTYTITAQVRLRVGLPPLTVVTNTAGVTGDRPWDECVGRLDETTGACEADADLTPVGAAVLAQSKLVKATDDDELDVIVDPAAPDQSLVCRPDEAGFYAYPCTPVVVPGHDETWRIRVDNVGNLPMDKVVIYDRLPAPGDTGSFAGSARGSRWEPILTDDPPPALAVGPAGAEATFYYTTADDYCMDDIDDPVAEPLCPTDDATTGWVELTGAVGDDTYSQVAALKVVITFPEDDLFAPGEYLALDGTTTTPPLAPSAGGRSIAWNSAAASGVVLAQGTRLDLLPTEGVKVGVAAATGPLAVEKVVVGDGAAYAPGSFEMDVRCTSAVGTWVETVLDPIPVTVVPGTPTIVENLPYGAECTVTEDGGAGESELVVEPVTILSEDLSAPTTITAVNRYDVASLVVEKVVVSSAVDEDGQPVPLGPYEAEVGCTFLGDEVVADGYSAGAPMVVELEDQQSVELGGLPVGSVCTVTETETGGTSSVTTSVVVGGSVPVTTDGPTAEVVLAPGPLGTASATVTLTNTFDVGAIQVDKELAGLGALYGPGPFEVTLACTDDGTGLTIPGGAVRKIAGGATVLYEDLPVGALCTVTETDDLGASATTVTVDDGPPVDGATVDVTVPPADEGEPTTVTVTVTNTFDTAPLLVRKLVDGGAAASAPPMPEVPPLPTTLDGLADLDLAAFPYDELPYEVSLVCAVAGLPVPVPGGDARRFGPGAPALYFGLPDGAACTVTETETAGATSVAVSPGTVTVDPSAALDDPVVVLVTNTFDTTGTSSGGTGGTGDAVPVDPGPGGLPTTGTQGAALMVLAVLLVAAGLLVAGARQNRIVLRG